MESEREGPRPNKPVITPFCPNHAIEARITRYWDLEAAIGSYRFWSQEHSRHNDTQHPTGQRPHRPCPYCSCHAELHRIAASGMSFRKNSRCGRKFLTRPSVGIHSHSPCRGFHARPTFLTYATPERAARPFFATCREITLREIRCQCKSGISRQLLSHSSRSRRLPRPHFRTPDSVIARGLGCPKKGRPKAPVPQSPFGLSPLLMLVF